MKKENNICKFHCPNSKCDWIGGSIKLVEDHRARVSLHMCPKCKEKISLSSDIQYEEYKGEQSKDVVKLDIAENGVVEVIIEFPEEEKK